MNYLGEFFTVIFFDLCGLCAFAGDIPSFGCGGAALGPSWSALLHIKSRRTMFFFLAHCFAIPSRISH